MTRPPKFSHPLANLANAIEEHVADAWPEIAQASPANVWFTGSHVWHFLYPDFPARDLATPRDWDIFTIGEDPAHWLIETFGWNRMPSCRTSEKWTVPRTVNAGRIPKLNTLPVALGIDPGNYDDGYSYQTDHGIVDLWVSLLDSAIAEVKTYPARSHAHCRVAWSFRDGLIMLPNECACERRPEDEAQPPVTKGVE